MPSVDYAITMRNFWDMLQVTSIPSQSNKSKSGVNEMLKFCVHKDEVFCKQVAKKSKNIQLTWGESCYAMKLKLAMRVLFRKENSSFLWDFLAQQIFLQF